MQSTDDQSPYVTAQIALLTTGAAAVGLQQLLLAYIDSLLVSTLQQAGIAVSSITFRSLDVQQGSCPTACMGCAAVHGQPLFPLWM